MLPQVGATELMLLAVVALIVVGPKDLPVLMRKIGQWVGKMRGLAAEFRSSFDELARQSELDELRKEVEALRNTRLPDPLTNIHSTFDEVSAGLDPAGFRIAEEPFETALGLDPHGEPLQAEPEPVPAKPARAPRKRKAAAGPEAASAEPAAKKPSRPRAKRAAPPAEADG
jgi:sec-independent protein translocase protein TatB